MIVVDKPEVYLGARAGGAYPKVAEGDLVVSASRQDLRPADVHGGDAEPRATGGWQQQQGPPPHAQAREFKSNGGVGVLPQPACLRVALESAPKNNVHPEIGRRRRRRWRRRPRRSSHPAAFAVAVKPANPIPLPQGSANDLPGDGISHRNQGAMSQVSRVFFRSAINASAAAPSMSL